MATSFLSQLFAPGASLSAQYQYVRLALFGSSAACFDVFDAALAAKTAAPRTSAAPRTASTCFVAMVPPLLASGTLERAYSAEGRLGKHLTAVDDERLAGDVGGFRRCEETDGPADLLRFGIASHRDRREHPALVLVARVGEALGGDVAGHDGVDCDPAPGELDCRGAHEAEHCGL